MGCSTISISKEDGPGFCAGFGETLRNIPELSADDTELKNYLMNLMVKEQVEEKSSNFWFDWCMGEK